MSLLVYFVLERFIGLFNIRNLLLSSFDILLCKTDGKTLNSLVM